MGAYAPEYYAPSNDYEDAYIPDLPQRTQTVAHDVTEEQERAHALTFLDSILAHLKANYGIPDTASNRPCGEQKLRDFRPPYLTT